MTKCQPIETAPKTGEFLAENAFGDFIKVVRSDMPVSFTGENAVVNTRRGAWWNARRWMPLPEPLTDD